MCSSDLASKCSTYESFEGKGGKGETVVSKCEPCIETRMVRCWTPCRVTVQCPVTVMKKVTECVPEIRALRGIDLAFLPMNLPNGRMSVERVAECARAFKPAVVFPYHYDQGYIARLANRGNPADGDTAEASVRALARALAGVLDVRVATWYPSAHHG